MSTEPGERVPRPPKKSLTREELIDLERTRLLEAVGSNTLATANDRVAFILNNFPHTRNSDKALCLKYWELYQRNKYAPTIAEHIFDLEHVPSIVRARAKVQNTYGLFQGSEKVRHRRFQREEELREAEATAGIPLAKIPIKQVLLALSGVLLSSAVVYWRRTPPGIDLTDKHVEYLGTLDGNPETANIKRADG